MFHVKLEFACTGGKTLTQVLSQAPTGESVAIQITDMTNSKSYSFQALHALPYANVASQLSQMGAADGEFLKWNNTDKKWEPGGVTGASGGTVTNVSVGSPLSISNPTTTPSITLSQANGSQSGYLSAADWNTFNSKEGTIAGGTATQFYRGDKTWQTLDTSAVPENVNLYFTNARALGVPLTGFTTATGAIVATDTTLQAFGKAQGQINSINSTAANYLIKNSTDSITGLVNVGTTGLLQLVYVPVGMNDATNKAYVDSEVGTKVSKAGDTVTGILTLDNDLRIKGGSNHVSVKGHAASANYNLTLPQTAGTAGYVLSTDGTGATSWVTPSVGSSNITDGSIVDADVNASAGIAQSKIANLSTDLAGKVSTTLSNGNILVGNGSNVATAVVVSGDATLSNTGALTLANTTVTPGTYKSVTVDGKGRVTGGTNPTTLAGYGITDTLVTGVSVTAPITNTGTASVPLIGMPAATGAVDGYLSSANFNTFNNKQAAITAASTINTGSLTSNLQGGVVVNPYNTAAGNTGELRLQELTANGTNYTGFKSPDILGANYIYTLPSDFGTSGQVLTTNAAGGLSWTTAATSSSSLTGDIGGTIGANTIGAGKVTLTHLSATGTKDNTTYLRGDNTFTSFAADVRTSVLTGLSTSTNAVITATDSVLSSLGKLQKQISDFAVSAIGGDLTGNLPNPTIAKLQGNTVTTSSVVNKNVLKYNGTAWVNSMIAASDLSATGTTDATTYLAGDNTWKNFSSSVRSTQLTGLSSTGINYGNSTLAATDSITAAFNKLLFTQGDYVSKTANQTINGTLAINSVTGFITVPTPVNPNDAANKAYVDSFGQWTEGASSSINYTAGNVGIGTTSPSAQLHVLIPTLSYTQPVMRVQQGGSFAAMTDYLANFQTYGARPALGNGTQHGLYVQAGWSSDADQTEIARFSALTTGYVDVPRMVIRSTGNIGIGTTTPNEKVSIEQSADSTTLLNISNNNTGTSARAGLSLTNSGSIYGSDSAGIMLGGTAHSTQADKLSVFANSGIANGIEIVSNNASAPVTLGTASTERMRISSTGLVGIGTTTPGRMLHVLRTADDVLNGDVSLAQFDRKAISGTPAAGVAGFLQVGLPNSANTVVLAADIGAKLTDVTPGAEKGEMILRTTNAGGASERVRIDNNGNVGIGNSNPQAKLEVSGGGAVIGSSYGAKTIGVVTYFSGASTTNYIHIKTPYRPAVDAKMYHFKVEGYAYQDARDIDLTFVGYAYNGNPTVIMNAQSRDPQGFFAPTQYIGSDGYVYLRFKPGNTYYISFRVDSTLVGNGRVVYPGEMTVIDTAAATL